MYETYVPIAKTTVERKPPTIAEIVREKTDDGARIIDFFLDVMEGRVEGAALCHRIDAAKQLVKYGSKKAADFIAEHGDETCDHCERRKRGPRPRKDKSPAAGPLHASPHLSPDFLTLLTEDYFTVLSAVDEDLMIKLVRAQTRDGGTVIDFLDDVMHGRNEGFKTNHRIAAGKELISHILRDEHVTAHAVPDNVEPAPYSIRGADPRVRPLPGSETSSPVDPARACPEPAEGYSIRRAGLKPALPGAAWEPCNPASIVSTVVPAHTVVVPAEAGTQRSGGMGATRASRAGVRPEPTTIVVPAHTVVVPAEAGTQRGGGPGAALPSRAGVRPEPTTTVVPAEAGTHPRPNGTVAIAKGPAPEQTGARTQTPNPVPVLSTDEGPVPTTAAAPQPGPKDSKPESLPRRRTRTQRRREGNARAATRRNAQGPGHNNKKEDEKPAPAELTPAERRIRERLDAYWHDPDPNGAPIDSTNPGRSPPW